MSRPSLGTIGSGARTLQNPGLGGFGAFPVAHSYPYDRASRRIRRRSCHGAPSVSTLSAVVDASEVRIAGEDRRAASRYIAAIVARDRHACADPRFAAWRTRELWDRFVTEYRTIGTGPYAQHGRVAVRLALGRL
jgi:hypothetical protein